VKYVAYCRVSTNKQGASGLGLEAQQKAVADHLSGNDGELVAEYQDIESGGKDDRPELQKALRKCRLTGATLLIAKLDRLSRNRRFLLELADSSINFVCCDMPEANNFTVGLLACLADYERQLISERTKAALAAAKARGVKLGNPNLADVRNTDTTKATAAKMAKASARNAEIREVIYELKDEYGDLSSRAIATRLNEAGYTTATGRPWHHQGVLRVLAAQQ
jgi:DNA invertase Pin-like site-specific DNA recombinase